jgi:CHAT domain-containing protein
MLVLIASPADQPLLDIDRELESIQLALDPSQQAGRLEYHIVQGQEATAQNLRQILSRDEYHIFHFLGHGAFDAATGQGVLLLEDPDGFGQRLAAKSLANLLRDQPSLRLAFLNACQTAQTLEIAPFASVAGTLVQAGVPAVLATQHSISDTAASLFARGFYQALAYGHPLEAAATEGRMAIELENQGYEWGVPVLYLRAHDGYVFR